jgi:cell division protein FtsW
MIKPKNRSYLSWRLFILAIFLAIIGLFFVFESSSIKSFHAYGDSFHYLKSQFLFILIGIGVMIFFSLLDYHHLYYLAFIFMIATILLLLIVLIPTIGKAGGGARRWLDFGLINFQPTEFAKLSAIIYLSSWFIHKERKRFSSFLILLSILLFLIMLQPDMGTAIIIFLISITIYFLAGHHIIHLFFLLPFSIAGFILLIKSSPYRFRRILAFINPELDPLGITYHVKQILISLGNGGLLGQGFGASKQKYLFLPEAHTDSIFAIIAEEMGFVGSLILILLFFYLIFELYQVAKHAPDRFGQLLSGGIFAFFGFQILINLGSMVNLIPLTGVPLSFISAGGSNLLISFALIGITINIAKRAKI